MTHIPVIINHRAGVRDVAREEEILAAFASHGISAEIKKVGADGDFTSLVRGCVTDRCPVVVVGGGDGSLHAAAGVLAGTDTALGILPVGTLNHLAKDLAVPLGVEDAVAVIVAGVIRNVDVGEANGQVFINNASLGLYPSVVRRRKAIQQRLGRSKWLAFAIATRRALPRYRLLLVRVRMKDNDYVRRTPFVFIGNNSYVMDGLNIGTRAALDAGVLSLYMARRESPFSLLLLALRALLGRLRQAKDFEEFTATEVRIETRRPHEFVGVDREVVSMETPIRCHVRPLALRVVVPAAWHAYPRSPLGPAFRARGRSDAAASHHAHRVSPAARGRGLGRPHTARPPPPVSRGARLPGLAPTCPDRRAGEPRCSSRERVEALHVSPRGIPIHHRARRGAFLRRPGDRRYGFQHGPVLDVEGWPPERRTAREGAGAAGASAVFTREGRRHASSFRRASRRRRRRRRRPIPAGDDRFRLSGR